MFSGKMSEETQQVLPGHSFLVIIPKWKLHELEEDKPAIPFLEWTNISDEQHDVTIVISHKPLITRPAKTCEEISGAYLNALTCIYNNTLLSLGQGESDRLHTTLGHA